MELRELRALVSIAEAGSLSGAAQKLNLTQPALSALLRRLEDELEVQIVRRHSRGVAFTAEGKFLLEKAHTILNDVAETTASLRELAEEPVGTVRIGLPASVAGGLVPELVPKILERYPHIQVHVVEAMSGSIVELLHLGRLDLAVLFDIQPMPGLRSEPFLIEEVMLLVSPDDPLGGLGSVSLEEVCHRELVLPSQSHSIRQMVERAAGAEGLTLKVLADVDSFEGLVGLARKGYATLLPPYLVMDDVRAGYIRAVSISGPQLLWSLHLATRLDSIRPQAAMLVGRMLMRETALLVRSGSWPGKVHPRSSVT